MYKNSGSKVMGLAKFIEGVLIIIGAVSGVLVWMGLREIQGPIIGSILGLTVFGVSALIAWISCLTLYAFGELVYKTSQIEEILRNKLSNIDNSLSSFSRSNETSTVSPPTPQKAVPQPRPGGTITCPSCKRANPAGAVFCDNCGAQIGSR